MFYLFFYCNYSIPQNFSFVKGGARKNCQKWQKIATNGQIKQNGQKWTNEKQPQTINRYGFLEKFVQFFVHLSRISTQRYKIILIFVLTSFFQKLDKWTKLLLYTPQTLGITAFLVKISFVQPVDKITFVHPSNPWYYWLSCKNLVFWTIPVY